MAWAETLLVAVAGLVALASAAGTLQAWTASRPPPPVAPARAWRPFATVIVPVRGEHQGFAANARAMAGQEYGAHEVVFVFDGEDEPCLPAVDALAKEHAHVRVAFTDPALAAEGWASGKIPAQLTGVACADPGALVLVFADADARPTPQWLASLVAPLADPAVGGVTGYRWYLPASTPTFWTSLRDAWNAVGLDAMTLSPLRFLWGGSMAVRRVDFERSDVRARWRTLVSEDVGLTRAVQALGLRIAFAPGALVASPEDWSEAEVREWVVRQSALTRTAMPRLFRFAFVVYAASLALFALGLGLLLAAPSPALGWAGAGFLTPVLSAAPRAWIRERWALRLLGPAARRSGRERLVHVLFALALPAIMLRALAQARRADHIEWRGRRYRLQSPR